MQAAGLIVCAQLFDCLVDPARLSAVEQGAAWQARIKDVYAAAAQIIEALHLSHKHRITILLQCMASDGMSHKAGIIHHNKAEGNHRVACS